MTANAVVKITGLRVVQSKLLDMVSYWYDPSLKTNRKHKLFKDDIYNLNRNWPANVVVKIAGLRVVKSKLLDMISYSYDPSLKTNRKHNLFQKQRIQLQSQLARHRPCTAMSRAFSSNITRERLL